jgi:hypothetical protein
VLAVNRGGVERVGVLPPLWLLGLFIAVALALIAGFRLRPSAAAPLLLASVLVLPWLPVPIPDVLLLWTGPIAAFVGAAVVLCAAPTWLAWLAERAPRVRAMKPPNASGIAGIVAFAVYVGLRLGTIGPPGGDEPHYLLITESLLRDGDIRVENNYARGDYLPYWGGPLAPHSAPSPLDGVHYSVHAPGVAVLVAPALRLAGYWGVVVWIAALVALGSVFVWKAAYVLTGDDRSAWFAWAATTLTSPVALHGTLVYPDPVAASALAGAFWILAADRRRPTDGITSAGWFMAGVAVGILPWLHTRLALPAACLGIVLSLRLFERARGGVKARSILAFLAPATVSAICWFAFFQLLYGTPNPSAPYGGGLPLDVKRIVIGLAGLAVDQEFGLFPNAPVHLLWLPGVWMLFRRDPRLAIELLFVLAPYVLATSAFPMWYAGASPPSRFLVPVIMPMGVTVAALWVAQGAAARAVSTALLAVSLVIAATLGAAGDGTLAYNGPDGSAKWLDWVAPVVNLPAAFPSFFRSGGGLSPSDAAILEDLIEPALLWAAIGAGFLILFQILTRRWRVVSPLLGLTAAISLMATLIAAVAAVWGLTAADRLATTRSQLRLLRNDQRFAASTGVVLPGLERVSLDETRTHLTIVPPRGGSNSLLQLPELPAGDYRVNVSPVSGGRGQVTVKIGRGTNAAWQGAVSATAPPLTVRLPVTASFVTVEADAEAGPIDRLELVPLPRSRDAPDPAARARDAVRYGSIVAFSLDNRVELDATGFWVLGWRQPEIILQPDSATVAIRLAVRNVGVDNRVRISAGRWSTERALAPDELWPVTVPVAGLSQAVRVRFEVERGLSVSQGQRGCRVELQTVHP